MTKGADLQLRAASDRFLAKLDRLYELEEEKRARAAERRLRRLPPGTSDHRAVELVDALRYEYRLAHEEEQGRIEPGA